MRVSSKQNRKQKLLNFQSIQYESLVALNSVSNFLINRALIFLSFFLNTSWCFVFWAITKIQTSKTTHLSELPGTLSFYINLSFSRASGEINGWTAIFGLLHINSWRSLTLAASVAFENVTEIGITNRLDIWLNCE